MQILAALTAAIGGSFFWNWYKFDSTLEVSEERYKQARYFTIILSSVLAGGFILELIGTLI